MEAVVDLIRDGHGRVSGARIAGADRQTIDVEADLVIGADGIRSKIARILGIGFDATSSHTTASIYGYFDHMPTDGYHWYAMQFIVGVGLDGWRAEWRYEPRWPSAETGWDDDSPEFRV